MYRNGIVDLQLDVDDIDEDYIKNTKAIVISGTAFSNESFKRGCIKSFKTC